MYRYETSLAAYKDVQEDLGPRQRSVFEFLKSKGESGATLDEIHLGLNWDVNCVTGRLDELRHKGYAVKTPMRRKTQKGKKAIVWIVMINIEPTFDVPVKQEATGQLSFI